MGLRYAYLGHDSLFHGIDEGDAIIPIDGDKQQLTIGCQRDPMRRLADFNRPRNSIRGGVDDVQHRRSVTAYVEPVAVLGDAHAVGTCSDRYRRDYQVGGRIDYTHGAVLEVSHIDHRPSSGNARGRSQD